MLSRRSSSSSTMSAPEAQEPQHNPTKTQQKPEQIPKKKGNTNCCVWACRNTYQNTQNKPIKVHFYTFPTRPGEVKRKEAWIRIVKKQNGPSWTHNSSHRLCSEHFIGNAFFNHPQHPSFVPSIFPQKYPGLSSNDQLGMPTKSRRELASLNRFNRAMQRQRIQNNTVFDKKLKPKLMKPRPLQIIDADSKVIEAEHDYTPKTIAIAEEVVKPKFKEQAMQTTLAFTRDRGVGNDIDVPCFFGFTSVEHDEAKLTELTSLKFPIFYQLRDALKAGGYTQRVYRIEDMLLLFLFKLKQSNIPFSALSVFFDMKMATMRRNFYLILDRLSKDGLDEKLPHNLKKAFAAQLLELKNLKYLSNTNNNIATNNVPANNVSIDNEAQVAASVIENMEFEHL